MNEPAQTLNIHKFITNHLVDVFDTMLSRKAALVDKAELPPHVDRICGCVGFGGENVTGMVYLQISAQFALQATSAMLGMAVEEITDEAETNDVIGELTNMLAGGLKSALCDTGTPCAVSTPSIIRGTSFVIESVPEVERICLGFVCENEPIVAEVHIKYI